MYDMGKQARKMCQATLANNKSNDDKTSGFENSSSETPPINKKGQTNNQKTQPPKKHSKTDSNKTMDLEYNQNNEKLTLIILTSVLLAKAKSLLPPLKILQPIIMHLAIIIICLLTKLLNMRYNTMKLPITMHHNMHITQAILMLLKTINIVIRTLPIKATITMEILFQMIKT